jgi:polyisoprenoid-binding protein YceI
MKLQILSLLTLALPLTASAKPVAIDTSSSSIKWVGKKVTGQHNGTVNLKSGEVDVEGNKVNGGHFEIDMTSIKVLDLTDAKDNAKLTGHLKSDDFFGVEKNPVATFKITSVKPLKGKKDANAEITGDLTIKGITNPVTFPAWVEAKDGKGSAKGKFPIDRTLYNVRYNSGKYVPNIGDKMIYDNFDVEIDIKTK